MSDDSTGSLIKDLTMNPFPKSFTVIGTGPTGNVHLRHGEGAVFSFLDGHVALLRGLDLGAGKTGYNLPKGAGRCYIDFDQLIDWTGYAEGTPPTYDGVPDGIVDIHDAEYLLLAAFPLDNGHYGNTNLTWNGGQRTLDIAAGSFPTNGNLMGQGPLITDTYSRCWLPAGANCTFMAECTVDAGTVATFGAPGTWLESVPMPTDDPNNENWANGKCVLIDTNRNFVQNGTMEVFSHHPYSGYTPLTYIPLPAPYKGKRTPIPAGTTQFTLEVDASFTGGRTMPFPTETSTSWNYSTPHNRGTTYALRQQVNCSVILPGKIINYNGPFVCYSYAVNWGRYFSAVQGKIHVKKLLFSAR